MPDETPAESAALPSEHVSTPPAYDPVPDPSSADAGFVTRDAPQQAPRSGVALAVSLAVVASLIVGTLSGLAGGFLGAQFALRSSAGSVVGGARSVTVVPSKTEEPVVAASAAAVPSVVNIDVSQGSSSGGENGLPNAHPGVPLQGSGSGVAFKKAPDGGTYVMTNNHVVENASSITVRDNSGKKYKGTLVGRDADSDIAVILIEGSLPLITLGDSAKLTVGQTVVAIGSPFGLEHSVTSGVVSALGRSLPDFTSDTGGSYPLVDVIQTDAAINPGNSGGALVDRSGRLVGINTAIYSDTGASGGIGFAIPVKAATRVADSLIKGGKVGHPFLGIVGLTVTAEIAQSRKLTVTEGALVEEVTKGTGASKAGLKPGDIVTALDSSPIRSMDDLILQVRRRAVGDRVSLTVVRDGRESKIAMTVGDRPANISVSPDTTQTVPKQ